MHHQEMQLVHECVQELTCAQLLCAFPAGLVHMSAQACPQVVQEVYKLSETLVLPKLKCCV